MLRNELDPEKLSAVERCIQNPDKFTRMGEQKGEVSSRKLAVSYAENLSDLSRAQELAFRLHRFPMIDRSRAIGVIRADQVRDQPRPSQNETSLAPWAAWGGLHAAIFSQSRFPHNQGKSLGPPRHQTTRTSYSSLSQRAKNPTHRAAGNQFLTNRALGSNFRASQHSCLHSPEG